MKVVGIDPGLSGALALLSDGDGGGAPIILDVVDMPTMSIDRSRIIDSYELARILRLYKRLGAEIVRVERQSPRGNQNIIAMGKLMEGYGLIKGIITTLEIPAQYVLPKDWRRQAGLVARQDKEDSRARAIERFPMSRSYFRRKMDHDRAEAALIALGAFN